MAKFRKKGTRRKRVYMARKRGFHRYASKGIGGMKGFIIPIGAGLADRFIDQYSPIDGIGATLVGMVGHNETVKNIGLYKVGFSLGNVLPIPGLSGTSNSGGF